MLKATGRFTCIGYGLLACMILLLPALLQAQDPQALLQQWMQRAAQHRSIHAEFEQQRKLSTVRNPLRSRGKLWLNEEGMMRWQIGEPPQMLLLVNPEQGVLQVDERKKRVTQWNPNPENASANQQGQSSSLDFLMSLRQPDLQAFNAKFEIVKVEPLEQGQYLFQLKFKERRLSLAVLGLDMVLNLADGTLNRFSVHMRDGSSMTTVILSHQLNATHPREAFYLALDAYQVTQE